MWYTSPMLIIVVAGYLIIYIPKTSWDAPLTLAHNHRLVEAIQRQSPGGVF